MGHRRGYYTIGVLILQLLQSAFRHDFSAVRQNPLYKYLSIRYSSDKGGVKAMKRKNIAEKVLQKAVEKALVADANRTSCSVVYQPKVPAKLETFKKTKA